MHALFNSRNLPESLERPSRISVGRAWNGNLPPSPPLSFCSHTLLCAQLSNPNIAQVRFIPAKLQGRLEVLLTEVGSAF